MLKLNHQSVISETGDITAVILDIETFKKIEAIIEDYGLAQYMHEAEDDDVLGHEEALRYLNSLGEEAEHGSV